MTDTTQSGTVSHTFASIKAGLDAIGDLELVDYQAVINGQPDSEYMQIEPDDLEPELIERGFKDGRDALRILLPAGHNVRDLVESL